MHEAGDRREREVAKRGDPCRRKIRCGSLRVVAYLLLGTEGFAEESRARLEHATTSLAPAHCEAELTNVVWLAVRAGVLPAAEGPVRTRPAPC